MNPFSVMNPESMDAEYIIANFVDLFTDAPRLLDIANTFIHGARGTGKSMLLRSLEPQVMLALNKAPELASIPFLSVHVPIRSVDFVPPESLAVRGYGRFAIGEHLLSMHAALRICRLVLGLRPHWADVQTPGLASSCAELVIAAGGDRNLWDLSAYGEKEEDRLRGACLLLETEIRRIRQYHARLAFSEAESTYVGPLTGFLDFVLPLVERVRSLPGMPDVPVFLMLDDADNLPQHLQRVLNSWVSTRTTSTLCLKITTQLGYATYRTMDDRMIESPHDFGEVDLSSIYTSPGDTYSRRIEEIVRKRLHNRGIAVEPRAFFPGDTKQAARLDEVREEIRLAIAARPPGTGGSARPRDEVLRTAVPTLMRELGGKSRSSHTYSYSGFDSLIDLSSGVIRWFLEPAGRMYDEVLSRTGDAVSFVPPGLQDEVVARWSSEFLDDLRVGQEGGAPQEEQAEDIVADRSLHSFGHEGEPYQQLRNLLDGVGRFFRSRLMDPESSEQRLFSFVVNGKPSRSLQDILEIGVRLGYLQRSDYASKEAFGGRLPRYILARRLGPHYKLDVSGYAAHQFFKPEALEAAMKDPNTLAPSRRSKAQDPRQVRIDLEQDQC